MLCMHALVPVVVAVVPRPGLHLGGGVAVDRKVLEHEVGDAGRVREGGRVRAHQPTAGLKRIAELGSGKSDR